MPNGSALISNTQSDVATPSTAPRKESVAAIARNLALDATKGALVLWMVFYHWTNYFVGAHAIYYPHIRFVTTSFILITGFLITHVYTTKYRVAGAQVTRRLIARGLKLLILFTALNVGANVIASRNYNGAPLGLDLFIRNAPIIYTIGAGEFAAFEILVPIAYLLIVAPIVLAAQRRSTYAVKALCAVTLLAVGALEIRGVTSYNLRLFAAGTLGMALGTVSMAIFDRLANRLMLVLIVYAVYLAVITVWGVPYAMQLVAACINVLLLYALTFRIREQSSIQSYLVLLGRYSLAAYIAQIGILQLLRRVMQHSPETDVFWMVSLVAILLLTTSAILLLDLLNARSTLAARMYRLVLG